MKNTFLLFLLLSFATDHLNAQFNFTTYGVPDGLPDMACRGIAVDSMGTLWVGTQGGVAKWNGNGFDHVPIDDGVEFPYVNTIKVAPDGNIWVGYLSLGDELGLSVIDPDGNLLLHADSVLRGEPGTWVHDIEFGPDGLVYIAIHDGIVTYDGNEWELEKISSTGFPANPSDILFDEDGTLWVGTIIGLAHQKDINQWDYYFTFNSGIVHDHVTTLEKAPDGRLWIGMGAGLSIFDGANFENYTVDDGLPNDRIRDIAFDETGRAWIMTDDGFSIFDNNTFQNYETYKHPSIEDRINDVLLHPTQGIWLTTSQGAVQVETDMTSTNELLQRRIEQISIYPVPATDYLNLAWENDGPAAVQSILLFDMNGRTVQRMDVHATQSELTMQLNSMVAGPYVLNIIWNDGSHHSLQLVKQ